MTDEASKNPEAGPIDDQAPPGESFYARWSRRKQAERQSAVGRGEQHEEHRAPIEDEEFQPSGERDVEPPPIDALDAESDYSAFLTSSKVGEQLKHAALRKLFHSGKFNLPDGLDDYAEDYRSFEVLSDALQRVVQRILDRDDHATDAVRTGKGNLIEGPAARDKRLPAKNVESTSTQLESDETGSASSHGEPLSSLATDAGADAGEEDPYYGG